MLRIAIALLILLVPLSAGAAPWHDGLYLANGGYWRQRIRVEIHNEMDRAAAGDPVSLPVGSAPGAAALAGASAEAVRVCNATGEELLFAITAPSGEAVTQGPIPEGSTLTIPTECPAGGTATCYVYFDNPSAWAVPDFLATTLGVRNGGMEEGSGKAPAGWAHDPADALRRCSWVTESPHSGSRCLKTSVAPGATPSWISTRQTGIHIIGGARYVFAAWVRAEAAEGQAGWYLHVGDQGEPMMMNQVLDAGAGTYGWREVRLEFTAPPQANSASVGTVLYGSGTAWFDDCSLQCLDPPRLSAAAAPPERLDLREIRPGDEWPAAGAWIAASELRVPVTVRNLDTQPRVALAAFDARPLMTRFRTYRRWTSGGAPEVAIRVSDGSGLVPSYQLGGMVLFQARLPGRSARTYYAYVAADGAAPGGGDYASLLMSRANLVRNPSLESGDRLPGDWSGGEQAGGPGAAAMGFDSPGLFGARCLRVSVPHGVEPNWIGWRQDVPVEPGKTYLYAGWVKCADLEGSVQLHAHYRNAQGALCESQQYAAVGSPISGTTDWTLMSGVFTMPADCTVFQLHLTMLATGTVWHDGIVLAEVMPAVVGDLEGRTETAAGGVTVWPVNALVKVFRDDPPPAQIPAARISAARNEKEPLQLAIRSTRAVGRVTVEVDEPIHPSGARLTDVQVGVVGYVPIDHASDYFSFNGPPWRRKLPGGAGGSDGWAGWWPDPLLPQRTFDLFANRTQPIWLTVSIPKTAPAGDYEGAVHLVAGGKTIREIPFVVHVWDFALPDESHVKAIYDLRLDGEWEAPGRTADETRNQFWRFMGDHRVCPDAVQPAPEIAYVEGRVVADFSAYDRAAREYFDVLHLPHTYTPWSFYMIQWGHPPAEHFGERPYEGEYPYDQADPRMLRPEYKRAYQACLKAYWDHMQAQGWADRVVLYVSDEPYLGSPRIREAMKAVCDMIHEVDPRIPIYASTWSYLPEWDGYVTVWGIGHYGSVPEQTIARLRESGARVWYTTDGHMCIDTPYCAIERMLPHYCFKYGVEAYEFWGISWLTYDPYRFGWHSFIRQSGQPGEMTWVRYPNGDGYLAYPGGPVGHDGPVPSIRLEQAREGVEDYEYLHLLADLATSARAAGTDVSEADKALAEAQSLVGMPAPNGRYSTEILSDPDAVFRAREGVARAIEDLRQRAAR